jgi:hypothetical protein
LLGELNSAEVDRVPALGSRLVAEVESRPRLAFVPPVLSPAKRQSPNRMRW